MGFDKDDDQPLIHPRRWGTRVNFAMAFAIILFFVFGAFAMRWLHSHRGSDTNDIHNNRIEDRR